MSYDNELVVKKLRRWEKYLNNYQLPNWEDIPDFGLYMEQVIALLNQYLDYIPAALKDEQFITAPTINNYVRKHVMPEPRKKMYFREHIAYLIMIVSLKQSLSLALIQKMLPADLPNDEVERIYKEYVLRHSKAAKYFTSQINSLAGALLNNEKANADGDSIKRPEELILNSAITSSFSRLLAEKLLLLDEMPEEGNE